MLEFNAMAIARTDAHTEVAPLIPQNQEVNSDRFCDATLIPKGKHIPIKNPGMNKIDVDRKSVV